MNTIARRIAAGATLVIAPAIIALGTATAGNAAPAPIHVGSPVNTPPEHTTPSRTPSEHNAPRWTPASPGAPEHYLHPNRGHHYVR